MCYSVSRPFSDEEALGHHEEMQVTKQLIQVDSVLANVSEIESAASNRKIK